MFRSTWVIIALGLTSLLFSGRLAYAQLGPAANAIPPSSLKPQASSLDTTEAVPAPAAPLPGGSAVSPQVAALLPPPCALERLPPILMDPPVPYYSRISPCENLAPNSQLLELPGVKLGWLFSLEVCALQPYVHNGLNSGAGNVGAIPEAVQVPQANGAWTAMPRFDLGYRFEEGLGEAHAIFRFLNSSSTQTVNGFDTAGPGTVKSQLNMDVLDLEYAFYEFNFGKVPRVNPLLLIPGKLGLDSHPENDNPSPIMMKWLFGVRAADVFFSSQGSGGQILSERVTNSFVGAGPRLGMEFTKPVYGDFSLYGRFEASGLIGETTQSFSRTEVQGSSSISGSMRQANIALGVPVLDASLGVRWVPANYRQFRFTAGYQFEQWFYLGETATSQAGLTLDGIFLRGEYGF